MNLNMLELTVDKTEFIMFGMKQQLAKINRIDINISGITLQAAEFVHNLGHLWTASWRIPIHINKIAGGLYDLIKDVISIYLHINQDTVKILVQALVLSKPNYCNSLLSGSTQYKLDKLQRVQNMDCRVVHNLRKYDYATVNMRNLH